MPDRETAATTESVTIDGIIYDVLVSKTPDQEDADNHHNIARVMREHKQARSLYLKRPKGSKVFSAVQWLSGRYGRPVDLGFHW